MTDPTTNEQLFDSVVRTYLERGGVAFIDQDLDGLFQTLEHGEGSVETALNVVVRAHAAYVILDGYTPFEKDAWTQELTDLRPRLRTGLDRCHEVLRNTPVDDDLIPLCWASFVPCVYGLEPWNDLKISPLFRFESSLDVVEDLRVINLYSKGELGECSKTLFESSERRNLTQWHRFLISHLIARALSDAEKLSLPGWFALVDLCANLVAYSEMDVYEYDDSEVDKMEIGAPATSTEFWAWQFGRVAALGSLNPEDEVGDPLLIPERFEGWGNGLVALSLLLGAPKALDWLAERCWTGTLVTWPSGSPKDESSEERAVGVVIGEPRDVTEVTANSHLYWLMRLGLLSGIAEIEHHAESDRHLEVAQPEDAQEQRLGSHPELDELMVPAEEEARARGVEQATTKLKEHLGQLWDDLPEDAQDCLLEAELNLRNHRPKDASLDYAKAVEVALDEWLPVPKNAGNWPRNLGDWVHLIRSMSGPKDRLSPADRQIRQRFDLRNASQLAESLEIFRTARLARAHPGHRPPRAHEARSAALGIGGKSVFELLLRFAKRWRG